MFGKKGDGSINIVHSTVWSLTERYIPSLIQIVSTLVIARLLTPKDFGEVAIVTTFIQVANLIVASGFYEALIYRVDNSRVLYSSVFYTNLFFAFVLYLILILFANPIAIFYGIPRLSVLIKVIGLNIIIYSFSYIQRIIFAIHINFRTTAVISFFCSIIGVTVGIILAFKGFGVWAIVFQSLVINLIQTLFLWIFSKWRPSLSFSFNELKPVVPYASKILFNNFIQVIYDNLYSLVLGKAFNAKILGYYNRMQTVVYYTTTNFMYSIESVFFPILCKDKENEDYLLNSYEKLLRISTFLTFPILVCLIALGKPLIIFILTEKWLGGLEMLKILSLAFLFVPVIYINNSFLKIKNKTNVLFKASIVKKVLGVVILFVSVSFSVRMVCYGILLYYFLDAIISMVCSQIFLKISIFSQIHYISYNILANLVLYFIFYFSSEISSIVPLKIIFGVVIGAACYLLIPFLFHLKESEILVNIIKRI